MYVASTSTDIAFSTMMARGIHDTAEFAVVYTTPITSAPSQTVPITKLPTPSNVIASIPAQPSWPIVHAILEDNIPDYTTPDPDAEDVSKLHLQLILGVGVLGVGIVLVWIFSLYRLVLFRSGSLPVVI